MLKAVIFDLDGTLTDFDVELAKSRVSEELAALVRDSCENVRKKLDTIHYQFNIESVYDRNIWWDEFDPHLPPKKKQELTNLYWKCVMDTTSVKEYADNLLTKLKRKGLTLVLLTDFDGKSFSKRERIQDLPIIPYFDMVVISGDDTPETKPSPEPFKYILTSLHMSPEEVLMVGDKPEVDLQGAHVLGIKTLLLRGDYGDAWEDAVSSLQEVYTYIVELMERCEEDL